MKVSAFTLGCKVNQYETQAILHSFENAGYEISPASPDTDVFIINSCTVTSTGDQKTRQMLHKYKRANPHSVVVLTGCYPQAFPEEALNLYGADVITGTGNRRDIPEYVARFLASRQRVVEIRPHEKGETFEDLSVSSFEGRTRAYLKIQDGCDNRCAYCIIPTARGQVRSKRPEEIRKEAEQLAQNGYKEIVLVGINLCFYGRDIGLSFVDGIRAACNVPGIERVRLGSLEPEMISDEDIATLSNLQNLCPSFHLSLQSGSDSTLKRMARRYNTAQYSALVDKIRKNFTDATFTTDVMVGFPGETDEEFNQSMGFTAKTGFLKVHVFSYSVRPGTRAAEMENQILPAVKADRSHRMIALCDEVRSNILQDAVGKKAQVLWETKKRGGMMEGYTKNYLPVRVQNGGECKGTITDTLITGVESDWCVGEIDGGIE